MKIFKKISEFFTRQELSLNMMCTNMTYQEYIEDLDNINETYND